jgi:hypothetical protein
MVAVSSVEHLVESAGFVIWQATKAAVDAAMAATDDLSLAALHAVYPAAFHRIAAPSEPLEVRGPDS